jgi:hypothetical protein
MSGPFADFPFPKQKNSNYEVQFRDDVKGWVSYLLKLKHLPNKLRVPLCREIVPLLIKIGEIKELRGINKQKERYTKLEKEDSEQLRKISVKKLVIGINHADDQWLEIPCKILHFSEIVKAESLPFNETVETLVMVGFVKQGFGCYPNLKKLFLTASVRQDVGVIQNIRFINVKPRTTRQFKKFLTLECESLSMTFRYNGFRTNISENYGKWSVTAKRWNIQIIGYPLPTGELANHEFKSQNNEMTLLEKLL